MDNSDKNLGNTKKGYAVPKENVYAKEIWNAAIEAAVNLDIDLSYEQIHKIRKLKK